MVGRKGLVDVAAGELDVAVAVSLVVSLPAAGVASASVAVAGGAVSVVLAVSVTLAASVTLSEASGAADVGEAVSEADREDDSGAERDVSKRIEGIKVRSSREQEVELTVFLSDPVRIGHDSSGEG